MKSDLTMHFYNCKSRQGSKHMLASESRKWQDDKYVISCAMGVLMITYSESENVKHNKAHVSCF